jgi:hypothetical protein
MEFLTSEKLFQCGRVVSVAAVASSGLAFGFAGTASSATSTQESGMEMAQRVLATIPWRSGTRRSPVTFAPTGSRAGLPGTRISLVFAKAESAGSSGQCTFR